MTESEARKVMLVRAIELAEPTLDTWSAADRHWATDVATNVARNGAASRTSHDGAAFLARRAQAACARLERAHPAVALARRAAEWPRWLTWLVPLTAFALGFAANQLAAEQRVNIISFPLLAMLAWNLAVYAMLIYAALYRNARPRAAPRPAPLADDFARWWYRWSSRSAGGDGALAAALRQFAEDWMHAAAQLNGRRARAILHTAAGLLAAGALAGLYVRGLALEYRAGWESTFLDTHALHHLLTFVLGPASWLSGIELPGPAELARLQWPEGHENAARWIHLYAITATLFILVPRFALAMRSAVTARRLKNEFTLPLRSDAYFVRLLSLSSGKPVIVDAVPYSYRPDKASRAALLAVLDCLVGARVELRFADPLPYGGGDEAKVHIRLDGNAPDYVIVLFNIAATPENENHGEFAAAILRCALPQTRVGVVLDASAYRERLGELAGSQDRLAERRRSWESMLRARGIESVVLDPASEGPRALAARLDASIASMRMSAVGT